MPPIILTLLQALFLLLLYIFVWRVFRAVLRDTAARPAGAVRAAAAAPRTAGRPAGNQPQRRRGGKRVTPGQLVVHLASGRPQVVALDGDDVTFGRQGADVVLDDPYISEQHARVYAEGGEWLITDLGSTNGTYLNQMKVTTPTALAAGDQLAIGKTTVEVRK